MFTRAWMVRISLGTVALLIALALLQTGNATTSSGIFTEDLLGPLTPDDLANTLAGPGITIANITYTGAENGAGTFSGGTGIIGFEKGIILSTGDIANVVGPNTFDGVSGINGTAGDIDLDTVSGFTTFDAAVLEFDFVADAEAVQFRYVFASEEYNEFVNSFFNDVFAFFINGVNCATVAGDAVTINTVNNGNPFGTEPRSHPELYVNNGLDSGGGVINTEMDGLTVVLTCQAVVAPGQTNHIKLALADSSDSILDSNVFLEAASFTTVPGSHNVAPTAEANGPYTCDEGSPCQIGPGSGNDPDNDNLSYVWDCDNNGTYETPGQSATCTAFPDGPAATVGFQVCDDAIPSLCGNDTATVNVANVPPTAVSASSSPNAINENQTTALTGSFADPGTQDTHTVVINWGDGSADTNLSLAAGVLTFSASHEYLDDNPSGTASDDYTISVTVSDDDTGTGMASTNVVVNNLAPVITATAGPVNPLTLGATATVTANFTDVGTQDTHTCTITWDDGTVSSGTVTEAAGSGSCTGSHSYSGVGVYGDEDDDGDHGDGDHCYGDHDDSDDDDDADDDDGAGDHRDEDDDGDDDDCAVKVTVTDDDTGSVTATRQHLIVYAHPQGGSFVIGDGNATIGNSVTFWGAQWWKLNSLSGGSAPASFKGFENSTTPPTCGGTWTTKPGNSSGPPGSIRPYIAVIVSSSVTKAGSTVSGNTLQVVIVKTNPGYAPNPGHAGTGTVVAVLCSNESAEQRAGV